jgi:hypothetical protein
MQLWVAVSQWICAHVVRHQRFKEFEQNLGRLQAMEKSKKES